MRDFLAMVMYNDNKPRFRRYLSLKPENSMERVAHMLKGNERYLASANHIGAVRNVISRILPVELPELHIALCELRDMELIDFDEKPFRVRLREVTGKKDFYTTQTYVWLQEKIQ